MLTVPAVTTVLTRLRRDVMRFAHPVEAIEGAMAASDPRTIRALLLLVPPAGGDFDAPWSTLDDLGSPMAAHVGLDRTSRTALSEAWTELGGAWRTGDAASVNAQLERHRIIGNTTMLPRRTGDRNALGLRLGSTPMTIRGLDAEDYATVASSVAALINRGPGAAVDAQLRRMMKEIALAHPIPFG